MTGIRIITAIFALLLTATASWALGGIAQWTFYLMPGPLTCATATAGIGEATVSFKPPKSDGGSPITRYTVTSHPGKSQRWASKAL